MGLDGAIRGWISNAGHHATSLKLIVVEETLIRLVHRTTCELACTCGAGPSTKGIGQVDALLFSSIKDVLIIRDFDCLIQTLTLINKGDSVRSHEMKGKGAEVTRGKKDHLEIDPFYIGQGQL